MTELDKLEKYLKEKGYKYEKKQEQKAYYNLNQIIVYDKEGQRQWDAICHRGSYGYEQGLLEIYGTIVQGQDSVEGWLTADDIIKRLEGK